MICLAFSYDSTPGWSWFYVLYPQGSSLTLLPSNADSQNPPCQVGVERLRQGILGKSPFFPGLFFSITNLHITYLNIFSPLRLVLWTILPNVLNKSLLSYYCVLLEYKSSKEPTWMPLHNFFLWQNIMQLWTSSQLHGLLSFLKSVSGSTNYLVVSLHKTLKKNKKKTRPQTMNLRKQISISNDIISPHVRYCSTNANNLSLTPGALARG